MLQDDPGPSIKKPDTYEALRDKGYSKEKAARISNAQADPDRHPSEAGGHAPRYESRTKQDLLGLARRVGVEGRSKMSKAELIRARRNG